MTAPRQERKRYKARFAAVAGLMLAAMVAPPVDAAITDRVVVDWHTGLAISGYDPVAFFSDGKPMAGRADLELRYGGAVWRFCNVGNRAAFAARPDVYMPQFGGYDPLGVASGVAVAGNPTIWIIADERLFMFYDHARREKFAADQDRFMAAAQRKWPNVLRTLDP